MKSYFQKDDITIYHGDCLEIMPELAPPMDMILCDLPYGLTACHWDKQISLELLWTQYKRLIKDNGAIVLTASQPFTSILVMSNLKMFKYCWVWDKKIPSNLVNVKHAPLKYHEDVCVFSIRKHNYYPQFRKKVKIPFGKIVAGKSEHITMLTKQERGFGYPKSILEYAKPNNLSKDGNLHSTQKPVALFSYLIRTYTNEGDTVLDNCIGSGTTLVAAKELRRKGIGIEIEERYCEISAKRVEAAIRLDRMSFHLDRNERKSLKL